MGLSPGDYFNGSEDQLLALAEYLSRLEPQHLGTPPLSQSKIDNLPLTPFNSNECKDCACTICRDELSEGEEVVILKCGHPFHLDCIKPWLQSHSDCPSCREPIKNLQ